MAVMVLTVAPALARRGGVHPAAVLGAAAVGGPAPEGFPPLPVSERVAAEGEPQP